MKADNRNIFAIKAFLREYLDLRRIRTMNWQPSTLSARELSLKELISGF